MDHALEQRLHLCYPAGLHVVVSQDQADLEPSRSFWDELQLILVANGFYCQGPDIWSDTPHVVEFPVYRLGEPAHWSFCDNGTEKIEALRVASEPQVAVAFKVSTILPALFIDIQATWFNPDTYGDNAKGRYDDGLQTKSFLHETAFEPWASLVKAVRALGQRLDLQEFDLEALKEDVPFVTKPMWSDDDEDEDDTDDLSEEEYHAYMKRYQLQYVCCLYDCLFGFV